jgi:LAO/AO transport system kinase
VIVETVGVGQSEVEVAGSADTVVVLLAPGTGDAIQVAKAGVLEVGDVYVVNKADRDGAEAVVRDLRQMLGVVAAEPHGWARPIVRASANAGTGIADLVEVIDAHTTWARDSGETLRRRVARAGAEIEALALARLRERLGPPASGHDADLADRLALDVATGTLDPWSAVDQLLAEGD